MCQLIFSHLKSTSLNRLAIHMLSHKGSALNGDGFGLYTPSSGLWKTAFAAESLIDIGSILRQAITDSKPVMAHVRAASPGIVVKDENAHPFEGARFVLAHNGRLWGKSEEVTRAQANNQSDTSLGSDSEKFLQKLEELALEFPEYSAPMLINKAMELFKGKFAFLIYDKVANKFYAIRGKTADLHYSLVYEGYPPLKGEENKCKSVGYVIMTKALDLEDAGYLMCTLAGTTLGTQLWLTKAIEFSEETAYELRASSPVEVASVKENPTYTPTTVIYRGGNQYEANGNSHSTKKDKLAELCEEISIFAGETYLDIVAMDELFINLFGVGIADSTENSLKVFVEKFMPHLRPSKKQRKMMAKSGITIFPHRVLCPLVPGLQFPWTLTTNNGTLAKAIEIWQREIKKK